MWVPYATRGTKFNWLNANYANVRGSVRFCFCLGFLSFVCFSNLFIRQKSPTEVKHL